MSKGHHDDIGRTESMSDELDLQGMMDLLGSADADPADFREKVAARIKELIVSTEGTPDHLHDIVDGYELFDKVGMTQMSEDLLDIGYQCVRIKIEKGEECDPICECILSDYIMNTVDMEALREAMGLLEKVCDPEYDFCEPAVFYYVMTMFFESNEHDHLVHMLDRIIERSESEIRKGIDSYDNAADAHLLRYYLEERKDDLLRAAENAVESMSIGGGTMLPVLDSCLNDVRMDRPNRSRLICRLRKLGFKV